jgi:predicted acylesterase/phospholipase RssA
VSQRSIFFRNAVGVFQGGGARAVGLASAVAYAREMGVRFSATAGTSAGSIIAVLISAGLSDEEITQVLQTFRADKIQSPLDEPASRWTSMLGFQAGLKEAATVYTRKGLYSTTGLRQWLTAVLEEHTSLGGDPKFGDLFTPCFVVAGDLSTGTPKIFGENQEEKVVDAVVASCALPGFFVPPDGRYVDGGVVSNLPAFIFKHLESQSLISSRLLAFRLKGDWDSQPLANGFQVMMAVAGTIVNGNVEIQSSLMGKMPTIVIETGGISTTDFKKLEEPGVIESLMAHGRKAAEQFFAHERDHLISSPMERKVLRDRDELFNAILSTTTALLPTQIDVWTDDARFAWDLFPFLLHCSLGNIRVSVHLPESMREPHDNDTAYQVRLLEHLCDSVVYDPQTAARAWVFSNEDGHVQCCILLGSRPSEGPRCEATLYRGTADLALLSMIQKLLPPSLRSDEQKRCKILTCTFREVEERLKRVSQYRSATMELTDIGLEEVHLMSVRAREYKVLMAEMFAQICRDHQLQVFSPCIVEFHSGKRSLVAPAVAETVTGDKVLLQGAARAYYSYMEGLTSLPVVVVSNVVEPFPTAQKYPLQRVGLLSRSTIKQTTIPDLDENRFRNIENAMHSIIDLQ